MSEVLGGFHPLRGCEHESHHGLAWSLKAQTVRRGARDALAHGTRACFCRGLLRSRVCGYAEIMFPSTLAFCFPPSPDFVVCGCVRG